MVDVWTTAADISNGYVPPSSVWSALFGTEGNLDFLLHRGWYLVGMDATERTTTSGTAVDLSTITGLNIAATQPVMIIGAMRKSSGATHRINGGLKINGVQVFAPSGGSNTFFSSSYTDQEESGGFAIFLTPRTGVYGRGLISVFSTRELSAGGAGNAAAVSPDANAWSGTTLPVDTITSLAIQGIAVGGGGGTVAVKDVLVYTMGATL